MPAAASSNGPGPNGGMNNAENGKDNVEISQC